MDDTNTGAVEYVTGPGDEKEPLGHETPAGIENGEIENVERTVIPDAPTCRNDEETGKYLVTWSDWRCNQYVSRVCGHCLPDNARGIAPGCRFYKKGTMSNKGEAFVYVEVGHDSPNGGYEWTERHGLGGGSNGQNDILATLNYELSRDTLSATVFDHTGEHRREAVFTIGTVRWDGATPIVEGYPVHVWLRKQAENHYDRIHNNDGAKRHVVRIDEDQAVLSRAKRAYREQHPDFEQPKGMINDYTPVMEDYIPVCSNCGEIVAGVSPEDSEPCEYCGSTEAEWMGDSNPTTETNAQKA